MTKLEKLEKACQKCYSILYAAEARHREELKKLYKDCERAKLKRDLCRLDVGESHD